MSRLHTFSFALVLALAAPGCIAISDFGHFHGGGGTDASVDGGAMDGGPRDTGTDAARDGGGTDGGGTDGGGLDGGMGDAGNCGGSCRAGAMCCDGVCTDVTTIANCGTCGHACTASMHETATCASANCDTTCDPGYDDCNTMASDGCERSITTTTDCGRCDHACAAGEACNATTGMCVSTCTGSEMNCSGTCADVQNDVNHCGSCTMACASRAGTTRTCVSGSCAYTCMSGYAECDSDPNDGCEALVARYVDRDGDTYGDVGMPATMVCPSASGYASRGGDCDDASASRNPGAIETCNRVDDNCNAQVDETFMWNGLPVGATCACEAGAATGTVMCAGTTAQCSGASEQCNGHDDDCDGLRDDGFACVQGTTATCTFSLGACSYTGTQTCDASCNQGSCVAPAETCNSSDEDCDSFVDEGAYHAAAPITGFGPGGSVHAVFRGTGSGGAIALVSENGTTGRQLSVTRFNDAGMPTSGQIVIASTPVSEITAGRGMNQPFDIGWDGTNYVVFYTYYVTSTTPEIRMQSVSATGTTVGAAVTIRAGTSVAVDTSSAIGVAIGTNSQVFGGIYQNGSWIQPITQFVSTGSLDYVDVVATGGGTRYLAIASDLGTSYTNAVTFDVGGLIGSVAHTATADGGSGEIDANLTWDYATSSPIMAYRISGVGLPMAIRFDPTTGATLGSASLGTSSNGPRAFFTSGQVWIARRPGLMRLRTSDMRPFPNEDYMPQFCETIVNVPAAFLCFADTGASQTGAYRFTCP